MKRIAKWLAIPHRRGGAGELREIAERRIRFARDLDHHRPELCVCRRRVRRLNARLFSCISRPSSSTVSSPLPTPRLCASNPASPPSWGPTAAANPTSPTPSAGCSASSPPKPSAAARCRTSSLRAPTPANRPSCARFPSCSPIAKNNSAASFMRSKSCAAFTATARVSTFSMASRAALRTFRSCSWTPASAARLTRSWRRARLTRSSPPSPRSAALCSKKPRVSPSTNPSARRPSPN